MFTFDNVSAADLKKIVDSLPPSYGFIVDDEIRWVHPGDPQYTEAEAAQQRLLGDE